MTGTRVPIATYRIQFNRGFRFTDARALVPYLHKLGISAKQALESKDRHAGQFAFSQGEERIAPTEPFDNASIPTQCALEALFAIDNLLQQVSALLSEVDCRNPP